MARRLDRYSEKRVSSRVNKNQNLYQDIKNYEYTDISDNDPIIKTISINELNINQDNDTDKKEEKDVDKTIEEIKKEIELPNKDYDINKIIDLAKKSRVDNTYEIKRKLKREDYNITNSIDVDNADEVIKNKNKQGLSEDEDDEIRELIDTIYSNTLAGKVAEKAEELELFNDLIATNDEDSLVTNSDTTINDEINKAIIEYESSKKEDTKPNEFTFDNTFYTKSMEIKKSDLIDDTEEMDSSFVNYRKKERSIIKIVIFVIVIVIFLILSYIYFKK